MSTVGVKTTSYVFKFLDSSVSYYVRVAAENEEGVGAWLELREPVKPQKPISESPRSAAVGIFFKYIYAIRFCTFCTFDWFYLMYTLAVTVAPGRPVRPTRQT